MPRMASTSQRRTPRVSPSKSDLCPWNRCFRRPHRRARQNFRRRHARLRRSDPPAHIRLGSARAFTKKDFLPYDNGYQYVYFVAAPRFFLAPFRKLNLFFYLQPEIALNVLTSNTLVKYTGNRSATGAAGGSLGAQFIISLLSVSAQLTCQYNWNLHTVTLGGSLSFGITSTIH